MLEKARNDFYEIYKKELELEGKNMILNNYILAPGRYILVDRESGSIIKEMDIKKGDTRDNASDNIRYDEFSKYDYNSILIDMDKPIDKKKVIHSNNYLSFFIKKDSLKNGKLTDERIDEYYEFVADLSKKYSGSNDKEKRRILAEVVARNGKVEIEKLESNKKWIKDFINNKEKIDEISGKDYLKIFFRAPVEEYEREGEKYLLPNIYNKNKYNIEIIGRGVGLPNNNMGMNEKKPFLENKTRKNSIPYLIDTEEALRQKLFFDYLLTQGAAKKNYIYINSEGIKSLKYDEVPKKFIGSFLKIKKGKELEIHDYDLINYEKPEKIFIRNVLDIDYKDIKDSILKGKSGKSTFDNLIGLFNSLYFIKGMWICLLNTDDFEVKTDKKLEIMLKGMSSSVYDWIYKGSTIRMKRSFSRDSLELIKHTILNGSEFKAKEMYNLRESVLNIVGEDEVNMKDQFTDIKNQLRDKCDGEEEVIIESVEEFSYAVGQLTYYLLSLNKGNKKKHSLVLPILNAKRIKKVKLELENLFKKYAHELDFKSKRPKTMLKMILGFNVDKVNSEFLLGGYLSNSLIYEKSIKNDIKEIEGDK